MPLNKAHWYRVKGWWVSEWIQIVLSLIYIYLVVCPLKMLNTKVFLGFGRFKLDFLIVKSFHIIILGFNTLPLKKEKEKKNKEVVLVSEP